jgi:hypothetical protein
MADDERDIDLDRRGGLKAIGAHVSRLTGPIARRRGTTTALLAADWVAVVGPEVARYSCPERLAGGPGTARTGRAAPGPGGTLRLRVEGPLALELQHLEPQLVERINRYLGHPAIARLQIVQGPLPRRSARPAPPAIRPLDPERQRALGDRLSPVADDGLRRALARLGQAVLAPRRP